MEIKKYISRTSDVADSPTVSLRKRENRLGEGKRFLKNVGKSNFIILFLFM